jgi:excisionase family DNA binding protein
MPAVRERVVERHLGPQEIADLVGVEPRTVVRWIRGGRISRARRLGSNNLWRVPESAVAAFLQGSEVERG